MVSFVNGEAVSEDCAMREHVKVFFSGTGVVPCRAVFAMATRARERRGRTGSRRGSCAAGNGANALRVLWSPILGAPSVTDDLRSRVAGKR